MSKKTKQWRAIKVRVELAILRWWEKNPLEDGASQDCLSHTIMAIFDDEFANYKRGLLKKETK